MFFFLTFFTSQILCAILRQHYVLECSRISTMNINMNTKSFLSLKQHMYAWNSYFRLKSIGSTLEICYIRALQNIFPSSIQAVFCARRPNTSILKHSRCGIRSELFILRCSAKKVSVFIASYNQVALGAVLFSHFLFQWFGFLVLSCWA